MAEEPVQIIPGQQMSEETKKKLAEENLKATEQAHQQAAARRAQDGGYDQSLTPEKAVAGSIADKLKAAGIFSEEDSQEPSEEN